MVTFKVISYNVLFPYENNKKHMCLVVKKMEFEKFINKLTGEDLDNFNQYKDIRGVQTYRIIFETLNKKNNTVRYEDVNSLVRYDKALKDVIYTYLGTLEDYIKNHILTSFDFSSNENLDKEHYTYIKGLPKCEKKNVGFGEITELYKRYALLFSEMIEFLKEYDKDFCDLKNLENVRQLRNLVMHHLPLLFGFNSDSPRLITLTGVHSLINLLPERYKNGIKKNISFTTSSTKKNLNPIYYEYLLEV